MRPMAAANAHMSAFIELNLKFMVPSLLECRHSRARCNPGRNCGSCLHRDGESFRFRYASIFNASVRAYFCVARNARPLVDLACHDFRKLGARQRPWLSAFGGEA